MPAMRRTALLRAPAIIGRCGADVAPVPQDRDDFRRNRALWSASPENAAGSGRDGTRNPRSSETRLGEGRGRRDEFAPQRPILEKTERIPWHFPLPHSTAPDYGGKRRKSAQPIRAEDNGAPRRFAGVSEQASSTPPCYYGISERSHIGKGAALWRSSRHQFPTT